MVFDPNAAPKEPEAFVAWYRQQTEWTEFHGYNNPDTPTPSLRNWFQEIIKSYPPMNGPLASDDVDNPKVTDYSVGRVVIYGGFAWSEAEAAYREMLELAGKHRIGFFDVSSSDGAVWVPVAEGNYGIAFFATRPPALQQNDRPQGTGAVGILSRIRAWFGRGSGH
jgi:hypothetical protein